MHGVHGTSGEGGINTYTCMPCQANEPQTNPTALTGSCRRPWDGGAFSCLAGFCQISPTGRGTDASGPRGGRLDRLLLSRLHVRIQTDRSAVRDGPLVSDKTLHRHMQPPGLMGKSARNPPHLTACVLSPVASATVGSVRRGTTCAHPPVRPLKQQSRQPPSAPAAATR